MTASIACLCEGAAEKAIIELLLDNNKLCFSREQLIDEEVLRCRCAKNFEDRYMGKSFVAKITVYRILDSKREQFKLRKAYQNKVEVINVITAPEIEMLVIISEEKFEEYSRKYKNSTKPSEYCKSVLKIKNIKDPNFIKSYFDDIDKLIQAIQEYKRVIRSTNNITCLADLLVL